jgi:type I restriction enzyme S subunit
MTIEYWELPPGWKWATMGEVADVIGGGTPKTNDSSNYEGGTIPWLTPADLSGYAAKTIGGGARYITKKGLATSSAKLMPAGAVLFTSRAPIGYVAIASNPVCTNQGFKSFVLKNGLLSDYVYWWLKGSKNLAESMASGTTFLELSGAKVKTLPIPVPPIDQQERIVAEIEKQFSRLDGAVANLNRAKANLKRYRAALLKAAVDGRLVETEAEIARREGRSYETGEQLLRRILETRRRQWKGKRKYKEPAAADTTHLPELPQGWAWTNFEGAAERVTVGHVGPMKDEYAEQGVPFLRSQNVRPNRYDAEGLKFISKQFHRRLEKSALRPGDLVVVRSGSVGVSCVIPEHLIEANCSDLVIVKNPDAVLPKFGAYYMNSVIETHVAAGKVGVALTHFNTLSVARLPLPLPPMAEQRRIVTEVDRRLTLLQKTETLIDTNLRRAERLRQSVLGAAFCGKLHFCSQSVLNYDSSRKMAHA